MKKYTINLFKFLVLFIVVVGAIIVPTFLIPVSPEIQSRITEDMQSRVFLLMFLVSFWGALSLTFIVKQSNWNGFRLFFGLSISFFGLEYFMAQIETFYFKDAFSFMPYSEIGFILIRGLITTTIIVLIAILLFGRNKKINKINNTGIINNININKWIIKSILFAIIYIMIYLFIGYFIAWQVEGVRMFYTGTTEVNGFFDQILFNIENMNLFLPYHFIRGLLWVIFSLPIIFMMKGNKINTLMSLLLLFSYHGMQIIMAQGFFPPEVLIAHTIETTISASIYGIIIGFLFYIPKRRKIYF